MHEQQIIDLKRTVLRLKLEKFMFLDMQMDYDPLIQSDVYIYGAGELGKLLFRCFDTKPKGFIDKKKGLKNICQVPVYCIDELSEVELSEGCTVIVTPVWAIDSIENAIYKYNTKVKVVNLEDLVKGL